jgi:hypothetical protein
VPAIGPVWVNVNSVCARFSGFKSFIGWYRLNLLNNEGLLFAQPPRDSSNALGAKNDARYGHDNADCQDQTADFYSNTSHIVPLLKRAIYDLLNDLIGNTDARSFLEQQ